MPAFERPSAISASTSRSRGDRTSSGSSTPLGGDELLDERGIDDRAALDDPLERVDELVDVGDAALQQVAAAARRSASSSVACSTWTCAESTTIAVSGNSSRIDAAASRPSVVCVGGIRMSTIARSGRCSRTSVDQLGGVAGLADDLEARTLEQAGQTLAQEDVVVGQHDPGRASCSWQRLWGTVTRWAHPPRRRIATSTHELHRLAGGAGGVAPGGDARGGRCALGGGVRRGRARRSLRSCSCRMPRSAATTTTAR